MFDIGFSELLLFGVIALIVLGPEKLPQAARTAGQWYAKIRRTVSTLQSEIEAELDLAETRQMMQKELAKIRQTEADMRREMAEMRGNMKQFEHSQNQHLKASHTDNSAHDQSDKAETEHSSDTGNHQTAAPTAFDYAYGQEQKSAEHDIFSAPDVNTCTNQPVQPIMTRPWENMWFRLGAYDKARRLPMPPYLPNYKADILLNAHLDNSTANQAYLNKQEAD
ncbi:Sec-independent protein translocase protein TatB [Psychrobacter sp. B38]|uniref:Sec-independent protein translocase protein TatB n=1 Tax=Psychrobacter sp. B38 TaxID=3143538 RepID=UPI003210A037